MDSSNDEVTYAILFFSLIFSFLIGTTHILLKKFRVKNILERVIDKFLSVKIISNYKIIIRNILFILLFCLEILVMNLCGLWSFVVLMLMIGSVINTVKEESDTQMFFVWLLLFYVFALILVGIYYVWYYLCLGGMFLESGSISDFIFSIFALISMFTLFGGIIAIAFGWDPWRRR